MGYRLILSLVLIISTSGCATLKTKSQTRKFRKQLKVFQKQVKKEKRTLVGVYKESQEISSLSKPRYGLREQLTVGPDYGFTRPYIPVMEAPIVRKVWIPAHKSNESKDVLIAGHWIFIKIEDSRWFIDGEYRVNKNTTIIVPRTPIQAN